MNQDLQDLPYTQPAEDTYLQYNNFGDMDDGLTTSATNFKQQRRFSDGDNALTVCDFIGGADGAPAADPSTPSNPEEPQYGDSQSKLGHYFGLFWATSDPNKIEGAGAYLRYVIIVLFFVTVVTGIVMLFCAVKKDKKTTQNGQQFQSSSLQDNN